MRYLPWLMFAAFVNLAWVLWLGYEALKWLNAVIP